VIKTSAFTTLSAAPSSLFLEVVEQDGWEIGRVRKEEQNGTPSIITKSQAANARRGGKKPSCVITIA